MSQHDPEMMALKPLADIDSLNTEQALGAILGPEETTFRLFAPHAKKVHLVLLAEFDAMEGEEIPMRRDKHGVWSTTRGGRLVGQVYGYRVWGPAGSKHRYDPSLILSDPYAKAVISHNSHQRFSRALIVDDDFDWAGDTWLTIDPRDAVVYEMHVRDMTAHESSISPYPGTYRGLVAEPQIGGLSHIKELGVNVVELLPVHDFGNIEIPYRDSSSATYNDWNPYERNHWGYMTTHFFAPEAYYAQGGTMERGAWLGASGEQVREFKELVKAFHQAGIAVMLDVVYNHVSQYDFNPFKYIDKSYYFRLNPDGSFSSESWCGNDFRTEASMVRRLIIDSVHYWMQEYHIDGFRFDLAGLIDTETARAILQEARKVNPDVIIVAEPWGGPTYVPDEFADLGWGAWNDQFRNGIKGQYPKEDALGFIFGRWQGTNNTETIKRYILGSPRALNGQFHQPGQSVNYLESHDDHTLGDFIRIGSGSIGADEKVFDLDINATAEGKLLAYNKLAALILFTSQGMVLLHEGQEFARSKVIAPTTAPADKVGMIDHNSYEKDDNTNYLNWRHKELNRDLFTYYQGLIRLRKAHPAFRRADFRGVQFLKGKTEFGLAVLLPKTITGDRYDFLVLLNGNRNQAEEFQLPGGQWAAVVSWKSAGVDPLVEGLSGVITIPPTAGMVLRR